MADTTTTPAQGEAMTGREKLAWLVIAISGGGIVLVSAVVIIAAWATPDNEDVHSLSMQVFSALVPMFATWVGTILAFYFSRENFKQAAESTRQIFREAGGDERLRTIPVQEAMIPRTKLTVAVLDPNKKKEAGILVESLRDLLKGQVTRIPVLDEKDVAMYVIHESMLYKYIAEKGLTTDAKGTKATLADFLGYEDMRSVVENIAFVSVDGTLADAKARMEAREKCQDVFVTKTGTAGEEVLGYLSNVDITKRARA